MLKLVLMTLITTFALQTSSFADSSQMAKTAEKGKKAAYVVISATVKDKEKLMQYGAAAKKTVLKHGGSFIAKSPIEALHGGTNHKTKIIIQFPDHASAKNWYESPEYQKLIPLRTQGMDAQFHLVN